MNESMNMLITRPRIWSVTNFCNSVFVTATDVTIEKPTPKRKISVTERRVDNEKPIKQIALELGFHDVGYFSRFFKLRATVSPEVYRQSLRKVATDQ